MSPTGHTTVSRHLAQEFIIWLDFLLFLEFPKLLIILGLLLLKADFDYIYHTMHKTILSLFISSVVTNN